MKANDVIEEVVLAEKISLRDYMAMAALPASLDKLGLGSLQSCVELSYKLADLMLKEKVKNENPS
jgi:hypothetical protein